MISSNVIGLAIYLGSWALVTFVIAFRFLLNSRPFLLKAIGANSSRSFISNQHKSFFTWGLLHVSPLLNNWLRKVQIAFKITYKKDCMTIPLLSFFCLLSNSHRMHLRLRVGQSAKTWLLTSLIILLFCLLSNVLSIALHVRLSLPIL